MRRGGASPPRNCKSQRRCRTGGAAYSLDRGAAPVTRSFSRNATAVSIDAGHHTVLLQCARDVGDRPVFDDLPLANAVDHDSRGFDLLVRRGDSEQFALVHVVADDVADDEVDTLTTGARRLVEDGRADLVREMR